MIFDDISRESHLLRHISVINSIITIIYLYLCNSIPQSIPQQNITRDTNSGCFFFIKQRKFDYDG